jgi:uncharacterized protein involved in exopolysaccharide biosynthesis
MDTQAIKQPVPEEISFGELRQAAANGRWLIGVFVLACTVIAGTIAWIIPKTYSATVTMASATNGADSSRFGSLGSLASQFGGIASLAGLSLPTNQKEWESIAVLQSEALTENFIKDNDLLPVLYADKWDANAKRWKVTDPKAVPTLWKANRYFRSKIRTVTVDPKTTLVTLEIKWRNPDQAAAWANGLVEMANDYLRNKAIAESERSIAYLNQEAAKTTVLEARQAIFSVLEAEIDKAMLARGTKEYAFNILDPAFAPERPSSLPVLVWMVIAFLASSVIAFFGVFITVAWNKT